MLIHNVFDTWPLKDKSVQAIITSPPYYLIRKYDIPDIIIGGDRNCQHYFVTENVGDFRYCSNLTTYFIGKGTAGLCNKCGAFKGQYGNEPHFKLYLSHTMLWLEEAWRVLKDNGVIFIVIDDKFSGSSMGRAKSGKHGNQGGIGSRVDYTNIQNILPTNTTFGVKRKSKLCIPEELMVMMRDKGWCIRNKIIWCRTMPESVKDRFSSKSETIIFASKNSKYYFNFDAIGEPIKINTIKRYLMPFKNSHCKDYKKHGGSFSLESQKRFYAKFKERYHRKTDKFIGISGGGNYSYGGINAHDSSYKAKLAKTEDDVLMKNPGDVWLDYYIETHRQILNKLGIDGYLEAFRKQILYESDIFPPFIEGLRDEHYAPFSSRLVERLMLCSTKVGDVVLDPFAGSGTTLLVAERLNRKGIGFDLGYAEVQKRRLKNIQKELPIR